MDDPTLGREHLQAEHDEREWQRMIEKAERLHARVARVLETIARDRAEREGTPSSEVPITPPLRMTFAPPAPRGTKSSRRSKQPTRSASEQRVQPRKWPPLIPIPLEIVDQRVICRYGHRTISLPIVEERVVLSSGLQATIQKIATTRFKGLAVCAIVKMPAKKRPGRRRKGSSGDASA